MQQIRECLLYWTSSLLPLWRLIEALQVIIIIIIIIIIIKKEEIKVTLKTIKPLQVHLQKSLKSWVHHLLFVQ